MPFAFATYSNDGIMVRPPKSCESSTVSLINHIDVLKKCCDGIVSCNICYGYRCAIMDGISAKRKALSPCWGKKGTGRKRMKSDSWATKKAIRKDHLECFHNGIILIVICLQFDYKYKLYFLTFQKF